MSAIQFELQAELRTGTGKGASRRLRRQDRLPAIIYGGGEAPVSITLDHKKTLHALSHEAFYSHILDLKTGDTAEKVILKDVQRHPAQPRLLHMDFQRVRADQKLHMHVPLHFMGEEKAPGLQQGGAFSHLITEVEVSCLPAHLPEFIAVDVSAMALNDAIHLSELALPEGVVLTALVHEAESHDQAVVSLHLPRAEVEEEAPAAEGETVTAESETAGEGDKGEKGEKTEKGEKSEKGSSAGRKEA